MKELAQAQALPPGQWQHSVEWREGSNFTLRSRSARVRVRNASRRCQADRAFAAFGLKVLRTEQL